MTGDTTIPEQNDNNDDLCRQKYFKLRPNQKNVVIQLPKMKYRRMEKINAESGGKNYQFEATEIIEMANLKIPARYIADEKRCVPISNVEKLKILIKNLEVEENGQVK